MNNNIDNNRIKSLVYQIPIVNAMDAKSLSTYVSKMDILPEEAVAVALAAAISHKKIVNLGINGDSPLTFKELEEKSSEANTQYSTIRRIIDVMWSNMIRFFDLIDKKGIKRGNAKKYSIRCQKAFGVYESVVRKQTEKSALSTYMDNLRLFTDAVMPSVDNLFSSIRDRLIALNDVIKANHSCNDIEVISLFYVCLILARIEKHSTLKFFEDFKSECGTDFSKYFSYGDMTLVIKWFVEYGQELGINIDKNKYGDYDIKGFNFKDSPRCVWAFNDMMSKISDEDVAEEAAEKALELNPAVMEKYREVIESDRQRILDESINALKDKYNVTKQRTA